MKYITIKILIILLVLVSFSRCGDFMDINHDPDAVTDVPMDLVLPAALSSPLYVLGGDGQIIGAYWAQHWTQATNSPQFQGYDSWQITNATFDGRGYGALYFNALNDLKFIKDKAEEQGKWSYYLVATVTEAYVFQILVDLYDMVPFEDALQGTEGNITPAFQSGQEIYDGLIQRIDYALEQTEGVSSVPELASSDIVFGGNINQWRAFANTLKLRLYLRQSFKNDVSTEVSNLLSSETFLSQDADIQIFINQPDKRNPVYASAEVQHKGNISMSRTAMAVMIRNFDETNDDFDPRVDYLAFKPSAVPEFHRALYQGDFYNIDYAENISELSRPLLNFDDPLYYMSAAESYFLQAEADLRFNGGANATALYNSGITASFARLGLSATDAETYYTKSDVDLDDVSSVEDKLKRIWQQKWLAMINIQGIEAFIETNRTDYPEHYMIHPNNDDFVPTDAEGKLTIAVNNVTGDRFPKRFLCPQSELNANPNVPEELRNKEVTDPVWWDVEPTF